MEILFTFSTTFRRAIRSNKYNMARNFWSCMLVKRVKSNTCFLAKENLIDGLKRVKNFNPFNVNRLAQVGAVAAVGDKAFYEQSLDLVVKGRKFLTEEMESLGLRVLPSQANFLCFESEYPSQELCIALLKKGIIIRSLSSFGMDSWCRITIGTESQNKEFVLQLKKVLEELT